MLNPPKKQFNQRFWWLMPGASEDFFWWRFSQTTVWRWWNQPTKMFAPIGNAPLLAGTPWESKPTNRCVNTEAGGSMAEVEKVHIADRDTLFNDRHTWHTLDFENTNARDLMPSVSETAMLFVLHGHFVGKNWWNERPSNCKSLRLFWRKEDHEDMWRFHLPVGWAGSALCRKQ